MWQLLLLLQMSWLEYPQPFRGSDMLNGDQVECVSVEIHAVPCLCLQNSFIVLLSKLSHSLLVCQVSQSVLCVRCGLGHYIFGSVSIKTWVSRVRSAAVHTNKLNACAVVM